MVPSLQSPRIRLTREVRFGLHETDLPAVSNSANGFAGNPPVTGIAPFLTLNATLSGVVDPATGMLINIKNVDRILRQDAVAFLRRAHYERGEGAAKALAGMFGGIGERFLPHVLEALSLGVSPYLRFTSDKEEPRMVRVSQRFEFSAAHRLHSQELSAEENREVFGRCNHPNGHGHNYELEVTVAGEVDGRTGEVMSLHLLQQVVNERVLDVFDHKHLNMDCAEFKTLNPTVENIAAVIYGKLKGAIPGPAKLESVRVWETPKTVCEVRG